MKRPEIGQRYLAPICIVLAFQLSLQMSLVVAFHQAAAASNENPNSDQAGAIASAQTGPMLSMGSESSSALESSAALSGDDLMAAESSQSPDAAEHKSFTSAQVLRQDGPQQQVSVAPIAYASNQQQQAAAPPAIQAPVFQVHPQHLAAAGIPQARIPQKAAAMNQFMAAALAGNYGPAQQQIAAAAAASMHHPHTGAHHAPSQPQQQHAHHAPPHMHHQQAMHHPQAVHHAQQQHLHQQQVAQAMRPTGEAALLAAQESSVRNNVVPPPNYNALVEANSIELNGEPSGQQQAGQHQQAQQSQQQQHQVQATGSQQLVGASSAQHPVIAPASSAMQEPSSWPLQAPDIPKIVNLEVKCEKNLMKVSIEFDKIFNGVIFSKGHYSQGQCVHVNQNSGKQQAYFDISINSCGTQGNTQNGLYGAGANSGSGTFFENTIVIQYDPNVQEVYDHARKLRCTWHDQYEKAVTFRPFPVDMLDIVRADFAGDNVGCWMQIQVGKGPWASEVAGIVKIGQTMTMVLAIKDEENKFDMLVRNCFAHDGKRGPIELVDKSGCITRPKLMSRFTKIKNFGSSATVLSYAHFQAFKFPDSMEVHFQCTIQICRHQCPDQCSSGSNSLGSGSSGGENYGESTISGTFNINGNSQASSSVAASNQIDSIHLRKFGSTHQRARRDLSALLVGTNHSSLFSNRLHKPLTQTVGLNRVIQVVSTGDLAFALQQQTNSTSSNMDTFNGSPASLTDSSVGQLTRIDLSNQICMSSYNFVLGLVVLVLILLCSCLFAISLFLRQRSLFGRQASAKASQLFVAPSPQQHPHHVPSQQQLYASNHQHQQHHHHHQHHQNQLFEAATKSRQQHC